MPIRISTLLILTILVLAAVGLAGLASAGNEGTATLFGIVICMPVSMFGGPLLLVLVLIRIAEWRARQTSPGQKAPSTDNRP